jgi:hypothetical protein
MTTLTAARCFTTHPARLCADAARRNAGYRGHKLDRFRLEAGRPTAVCACGTYVFVEREGMGHVWGYGRLPGAAGTWGGCRRHEETNREAAR